MAATTRQTSLALAFCWFLTVRDILSILQCWISILVPIALFWVFKSQIVQPTLKEHSWEMYCLIKGLLVPITLHVLWRWSSARAWRSPPGPWSPSSAPTWWRGGEGPPPAAGFRSTLDKLKLIMMRSRSCSRGGSPHPSLPSKSGVEKPQEGKGGVSSSGKLTNISRSGRRPSSRLSPEVCASNQRPQPWSSSSLSPFLTENCNKKIVTFKQGPLRPWTWTWSMH